MGIESGVTYPGGLNSAWPLDTDTRREGAAHIRETKLALKNVSKLLAGTDATKALFEHRYPVGVLILGNPIVGANPNDDIGGTWGYAGKFTLDPTGSDPGVIPYTELWAWQRLA